MYFLLILKSNTFIYLAIFLCFCVDFFTKNNILKKKTAKIRDFAIYFLLLFPIIETFRGYYELFVMRIPQNYFSYYTNVFMFPFSDADGYLNGAFELNIHKSLSYNALYRPLGNILNAVILNFCAFDLYYFYICRAVIVCISISILNIQIIKYINLTTAFILTLILCRYHNLLLNTVMSENWGLFFGCISTAYFILGIKQKKVKHFFIGIFAFTIGMDIRTGAMFTFPLIIIFGVYYFTFYNKLKTFFLILIIIFSGFLVRPFTQYLITGNTRVISNAPLQIYDLATNGHAWDQILHDYPLIKNLDFEEKFEFAQNKAIKSIKYNKKLIITSLIKRYIEAIPTIGFYKFKNILDILNLSFLNNFFFILSLLACLYLIYPTKVDAVYYFVFLVILGNWLTYPILRGIEERLYIVTIPTSYLCLGLGINNLIELLQPVCKNASKDSYSYKFTNLNYLANFFSYSLLIITLIFAIFLVKLIQSKPINYSTFNKKDSDLCLMPISSIEIDTSSVSNSYPTISISDYEKNPIRIDIDSWAGIISKHIGKPQKYIYFAYNIKKKTTCYYTSNLKLAFSKSKQSFVNIPVDSSSDSTLIKTVIINP